MNLLQFHFFLNRCTVIPINCFSFIYSGPIDFSSKHNHSSPVSSLPVHPDVRLKRLPFYDILGELLKPTSLGMYAKKYKLLAILRYSISLSL